MKRESWALHYLLVFVGGGSAGTAGGVKVSTFAVLLLLLVVDEVRGHPDTEAFGRRISQNAQRQAIAVLVLGSSMVVLGARWFCSEPPSWRKTK